MGSSCVFRWWDGDGPPLPFPIVVYPQMSPLKWTEWTNDTAQMQASICSVQVKLFQTACYTVGWPWWGKDRSKTGVKFWGFWGYLWWLKWAIVWFHCSGLILFTAVFACDSTKRLYGFHEVLDFPNDFCKHILPRIAIMLVAYSIYMLPEVYSVCMIRHKYILPHSIAQLLPETLSSSQRVVGSCQMCWHIF